MGRAPERSKGVTFVKKIKAAAAFCIKKNAQNLFAELIASIPTTDNPHEHYKKRTKTYSCRKCKKKLQTKDDHARHEDSCKINKNSHKKSVNKDSAHKSQEKCKGNRNKTQRKNKNKNESESKKEKCVFCKKKYVRIEAHYISSHKINHHMSIKKLTEKDSQRNKTTCPLCNVDQNNVKSLREHYIEYHKINLRAISRKQCFKAKKGQTCEVVQNETAAKERESKGNNPGVQEEKAMMENNPVAQVEKEMTEPATQEGEITENPKVQDKRQPIVDDVQKLCEHCNQFVSVSSIESHTASHQRERETFAFKTSYSTQHAASRHNENLSHAYDETVEKNKPRSQGEYETVPDSNDDATKQNSMKDDNNHSRIIQSEEEFQTTRDPLEDVGTNNSGQNHTNGSHDDISEDMYMPQNIIEAANVTNNKEQIQQAQEDLRRSRFKLLWNDYFRRMLLANDNNRQELYIRFLNEYASLAHRSAVCLRRLNIASIDNKRRSHRRVNGVDVVSRITLETHTSTTFQSGVSCTRKRITHLKTIKYETSNQ